jgi:putative hemolysin
MLAELMLRIRPDVKVMANYLLSSIPRLRDLFIFVDPFETNGAIEKNLAPLREAMRWVENGGLLVIFPAGEVAHLKFKSRKVADPPWNPAVARIVSRTKSPVVPAFFHGKNGPLFQIMGLLHPRLRTAMLPRQLVKSPKQGIELTIGGPIPYKHLAHMGKGKELTDYLRWRTHLLHKTCRQKNRWAFSQEQKLPQEPVFKSTHPVDLAAREIADLPPEKTLAQNGKMRVVMVKKSEAPEVIKEIGRLREVTFRQVGEGTGNELDLDKFDDYYLHLCLWDDEKNQLAGGYRIGLSDEIIHQHGVSGLYISTLFKIKPKLFEKLGPALELGRSFVRPEYQRSYSALLLLWKGIGSLVAQTPKYRHIFGPVSVSNNYHPLSRRFMIKFFQKHLTSDFSGLVRPRRPVKFRTPTGSQNLNYIAKLKSLEELSTVVADIEGEARGIPILLQQYVKLASRSVGWNLDPNFGNVVDCFLISDLTKVHPKVLARYCGKKQTEFFLNYHASTGKKVPLCA